MSDMDQTWIRSECWISGCHSATTHVLETRVRRTQQPLKSMFRQLVGYCRWDANGMAVALVTNYDHEYEILDIRPVKDEEFEDEDDNELHRALLS